MHIFVDTSTITADKSGTGVYTAGLLKALLKADWSDRITACGGDLSSLSPPPARSKLARLFPGRTDWHTLINRKLAGNQPNIQADLAIFPNYFMPPAFSIPSLVTIHDVSFLSHPHFYSRRMRWYYRTRIRHTLHHADHILTVSKHSKNQIRHYFPGSGDRIQIIRPGYHLASGEPNKFPSASGFFLYLGSLEPRKNILGMLRGFNRAKTGNTRLVLVGKFNAGRRYQHKVKQAIAESRHIQYCGYQSEQTVRRLLAGADGLVNVSKLEGFGLSLLEGLASKTPCLISGDPALNELASDQAVTVDAHDPNSIAGGFEKLMKIHPPDLNGHTETLRQQATWKNFQQSLGQLAQRLRLRNRPVMKSPRIFDDDPIKQSILEALAYSSVFRAPIEKTQLYRHLTTQVDPSTFEGKLSELLRTYPDLIKQKNQLLYLSPWSRPIEDYLKKRRQNRDFLHSHHFLLRLADRLPWVRGLYLSGGSVHGTELEERDIDLFVVTQSNRVWIVYTLLKLLSRLLPNGSLLCYNYLVDSDALHIHYQQDFFTAHQLLCLQPALQQNSGPDLKAHNEWIKQYFPNIDQTSSHSEKSPKSPTNPRRHSRWNPLYLLNLLLMACFSWIWHKKGLKNGDGGLLWDAHRIKIHTNDHRPWIYQRFNELMHSIKKRISHKGLRNSDNGSQSKRRVRKTSAVNRPKNQNRTEKNENFWKSW